VRLRIIWAATRESFGAGVSYQDGTKTVRRGRGALIDYLNCYKHTFAASSTC